MYKHVYMYFMHTQIHVYMQSHVDKDTHNPVGVEQESLELFCEAPGTKYF